MLTLFEGWSPARLGVVALATVGAMGACTCECDCVEPFDRVEEDDGSGGFGGSAAAGSECTEGMGEGGNGCEGEIADALIERSAAECLAFCAIAAGCEYDQRGGPEELRQSYIDTTCSLVGCTDDVATLMGPFIDRCSAVECSEMSACVDDTKVRYGEYVADCAAEINEAFIELFAALNCIVAEAVVGPVVCMATFFQECD